MTYSQSQIEAWLEDMSGGALDLNLDNKTLARDALILLRGGEEVPIAEDSLSPNFTLAELTYSDTANACGIDNTPGPNEVANLEQLAMMTLEGIRSICGNNELIISSGYRCPELNTKIGGATNSAHLYGCAADFTIPEFGTPLEVCRAIEPFLADLGIDQLIHENDAWVHVGRAPPPAEPRGECLTVDGGQTVLGIV